MPAKVTRILSILCIALAFSQGVAAQANRAYRLEVDQDGWSVGMTVGKSELWGDVGTKGFVDHFKNSKHFDKVAFMGGMFGRYSFHPAFCVRLSLTAGSVYATDAWNYDGVQTVGLKEGNDYVQRYLRSQTAKASVVEAGAMLEILPMRFNLDGKGAAYRRGQPFIGAGFALFYYMPFSTVAKGTTFVKTYDLALEGQGWGGSYPKQPAKIQPAFPLAIGYRWDIGQHLNLGIEYMYRMTMFDYLDGVSGKYISKFEYEQNMASSGDAKTAWQVADKQQFYNNSLSTTPGTLRGNPGNNDGYSTFSIIFSYKVPTRNKIFWRHKQF